VGQHKEEMQGLGTAKIRKMDMWKTCTCTERPYEALLFPGIGFGLPSAKELDKKLVKKPLKLFLDVESGR
jgi:hypothetical protein